MIYPPPPMKIFVDLNSVLSNFDGHYRATIGPLPTNWRDHTPSNIPRSVPPVTNWSEFDHTLFYNTMPPMPDMDLLWRYLITERFPTILSGIPGRDKHQEHLDTVHWVQRNIGLGVSVLTCLSSEKHKYGGPNTLLIDDWERYKHLWVDAGGLWITHTSAEDTIEQLMELGL